MTSFIFHEIIETKQFIVLVPSYGDVIKYRYNFKSKSTFGEKEKMDLRPYIEVVIGQGSSG